MPCLRRVAAWSRKDIVEAIWPRCGGTCRAALTPLSRVKARQHAKRARVVFEKAVARLPESGVPSRLGEEDIFSKFVVPDIDGLSALSGGKLLKNADRARVRSKIAIQTLKDRGALAARASRTR